LLSGHVSTIVAKRVELGQLVRANTIEDLIAEYCKDNYPPKKNGAVARKQCKKYIEKEKIQGFVGTNLLAGTTVLLDDGTGGTWPETHDVIYDAVSLLPVSGGKSHIALDKRYGHNVAVRALMNGGFTEYYTRLVCRERGVPSSKPKHPYFYAVLSSFCQKHPEACWKAYMHNQGFDTVAVAVAAMWTDNNKNVDMDMYTMKADPSFGKTAVTTLYSSGFYGEHIRNGWCVAVGDSSNGICHPKCEKECYTLSKEGKVDPCFKFCAAATDGLTFHPSHDEL